MLTISNLYKILVKTPNIRNHLEFLKLDVRIILKYAHLKEICCEDTGWIDATGGPVASYSKLVILRTAFVSDLAFLT
jgi:hypothetical protein